MQNMDWYQTLVKPPFTPPDAIFAPVWTVLYILIALSLILFMRAPTRTKKGVPFLLFLLQMIFNLLWTVVFFDMKNPVGALVVLALLACFLFATVISFYKVSKTATMLLLPYLAWTAFALYLNTGIVLLN